MSNDLTIQLAQIGSPIAVPEEGNVAWDRVERVLAWLKEHEKFWNQHEFVEEGRKLRDTMLENGNAWAVFELAESEDGKNECGTTFCLAGAALMLYNRLTVMTNRYKAYLWPVMAHGEIGGDFATAAAQLLGLENWQKELLFYTVPADDDADVDVFIQYVREVLTTPEEDITKDRYYALLAEKREEDIKTYAIYLEDYGDDG